MAAKHSKSVVYAAFAGNLLVTLTKFVAAWWTGSSAMLSEAIHSVVDTGNQLLLLYGLHRADLPPDEQQPLGYGRELYFWSFVVALIIFTAGAGVAFYEGVQHIANPHPIVDPHVSDALERRIRDAHPEVIAVFVRPQPVEPQMPPIGRFFRRAKLLSDLKRGSETPSAR
ncbi:cation transporter [Microbacteriaceae bacterium K1510]|nr:cation transporter [Microbacteriaceae bacterium K1510]